ncbi:hypothetical protein AVEN_130526-1 [Araneus ventricosus]|uniref:Uncharacterized protein n=1 Tax=Araneus ventricosus TaxID=182803 RepID=A0A4Y2EI60_ARAVE|nr:hypothetical protein AVEN_130526-1 [Araneus ventricosus]
MRHSLAERRCEVPTHMLDLSVAYIMPGKLLSRAVHRSAFYASTDHFVRRISAALFLSAGRERMTLRNSHLAGESIMPAMFRVLKLSHN